jgi:ABC-type transport system involved in multi-copper enzyme maturation permease subunit
MSTTTRTDQTATAQPARSTTMSTWRLSFRGLKTVVDLELRQRVRSRRWIIALVAWFLVIGAMTALVILASSATFRWGDESAGPLAFGLITLFVLGAGLVVAPAFTATSINGDRTSGTLATLQATSLSTVEIVAGKLVAAWAAAAVFLVAALPFTVWSMVLGGISVWQVLVCFLVVFIEVAVVCAIGIGFSSLFTRTVTSTLMTYLMVVALCVLTVVVPGVATVLVADDDGIVQVYGLPPDVQIEWEQTISDWYDKNPAAMSEEDFVDYPKPPVQKCTWYESTDEWVTHTERIWWMVLPNPFVVVADVAPLPSTDENLATYTSRSGDPLAGIRLAVRTAAHGPETERDECWYHYMELGYGVSYDPSTSVYNAIAPDNSNLPDYISPVDPVVVTAEKPLWPWGLGFNLLLGAVCFWLAVHRLKVPYKKLATGTRVA